MLGHWKLLGLAAVMLVALASSAYAYWRINATPSQTLYVTATSPPLELRMELDKTEFELGENVTVYLSLKNVGDHTINVTFPHIGNKFYITVRDANSTAIYESLRGGFHALWVIPLDPREVINETIVWPQVKQLHETWDLKEKVPPGTYTLTGHSEGNLITATERLVTPPITITIG